MLEYLLGDFMKKLDSDFYLDKYSYINNGEGIAGVGIISNKQMINVYTKSLNNIDGISGHANTIKYLLDNIYNKDYEDIKDNIILIKYINEFNSKYLIIYFPNNISIRQYEYLKSLYNLFNNYNIEYYTYYNGRDYIFDSYIDILKMARNILNNNINNINENILTDNDIKRM